MKRLNGLFVLLILLLGLLSIAYIWKSEDDKEILEAQVTQQIQEIDSLKNKLSELNSQADSENVNGVSTSIGVVTGKIQFNDLNLVKTTVICAQDQYTIKEFCTDELIKTNDSNVFEYTLEIPRGKYSIYALNSSSTEKVFYSNVQKCNDDKSCTFTDSSDNINKILLQITENEVQKDINLYL